MVALLPSGAYLSVIALVEVRHGLARKSAEVHARFDQMLRFAPVLAIDRAIAERCAAIRIHISDIGHQVRSRPLDLLIAATAIEYGLTVVTNNRPDYRDVPGLLLLT